MRRPVVVFEDDHVGSLCPLAFTRPVFDLICGILPLREKVCTYLRAAVGKGMKPFWHQLPEGDPDIRFHLRDYLASGHGAAVASYQALAEQFDSLTFINGRLLFGEDTLDGFDAGWRGKYVCGDNVVMANVSKDMIPGLDRYRGALLGSHVFSDLPARELKARLIQYPWELVSLNGEEIDRDFALLGGAGSHAEVPAGVHVVGKDNLRMGKGVKLGPGAVIDASSGPVNLDSEVVLMPNASLQGPVHVGSGTTVRMGATIYGGTSIGPVCKIGGEIGETIIQGYSNKQHGGFLGHSYLGEWVNLGAGTNVSDLKNNYSTVRVSIDGKEVDSGEMFVGVFMGDHSKSGIGTILNTGTVVGVCCNVFGGDYPPKNIPSFTWGGSSGFEEYDPDKAIETAVRATGRRGRTLDSQGRMVLRKVFELTAGERQAFLA